MELSQALLEEALVARSPYLLSLLAVTFVLVRLLKPSEVRVKGLVFFAVFHVIFMLTAASLRAAGSPLAVDFRVPSLAFGAVAGVGAVAALIFGMLLPRLKLRVPRILQDVLIAIASVITLVTVLSKAGVNLSGLIATSAVATAVIGFSLQDVIGNVAGGLALQIDNSIEVGDWVKVGEVVGRVVDIRWRFTAIETRNWETVLLPNSTLMKSQVSLLGRRSGERQLWRRWVYFNVDYRFQPSEVIDVVTQAVRSANLERVATDPQPNCVLMELAESYGHYAVRYWLDDLNVDDPTDSEVRSVIYFALQRQGMRLSIPAHAIFVTEESSDRVELKQQRDLERRKEALSHIDLLSTLSDAERELLARGLRYAPFRRGEVLTRQGAEAHWLYLIDEGEVSVQVADNGVEKEVARLKSGSFFGEMSLLTGAVRSATVKACTDVECFRLEKDVFKKVVLNRPDLAQHLAKVLAQRQVEIDAARATLGQGQLKRTEENFLSKIRDFFGLED